MLKVVVVGLGPIGIACARAVRAEVEMELVGLVDLDPAKQGRVLGELEQQSGKTDEDDASGPQVTVDIAQALAGGEADVAILTTASRFDKVAPTLRELLAQGLAVVSSCEEMAWPWYQHPALADEMDAAAKKVGRAILGTGVNPGFVMDSLAVVLSAVVRRVTSVRCVRRVDAGLRRVPLQKKVGATMTVADFAQKARAGKLGHMGIGESVAMLARGLGRSVQAESVQIALDPVVAEKPLASGIGLIEPGRVAGIHNTAHWAGADLTIDLDLTMAVGVTDPYDLIEINGPVPIRVKIPGGLPGDSATVAVLLNYARAVPTAPAGLRTMLDLPPAGCRGRE